MMKQGARPFASRVQAILILMLVISFVLITQQISDTAYRVGLGLLIVTTFVQIAFGNIDPRASFGPSMKILGLTLLIIAVIFGAGIAIAPYLIQLGRG
ncbi:hypothetical protein P9761_14355 [Brevibacillus centrosporus]|uniref:hypothetical protein n=1 Tax=Brevibacillus centrosporus TaxID=54910 RepID=UPI002E22F459|nr:hypothetical protein [Brevibacillus centrosporus]